MVSRGFWRPSFAAPRRAETLLGALAIVLLPTLIFAAWPAPASDSAFDSARLEVLLQRNPATGRPVELDRGARAAAATRASFEFHLRL